ncbi:MAG: hypothetical protein KJT03_19995, partial [Verrucomicrobiae bacterium]|nr:hypothetical protein [Verrucomicrobiae bacterium]
SAPQQLTGAAGNASDFEDFYLQALVEAGVLRYEDLPPEARIDAVFNSELAVIVAGLLAQEGGSEIISTSTDELAQFFELVRTWANHNPDAYGSPAIPDGTEYDLGLSHETHFEAFRIQVKVPSDFFFFLADYIDDGSGSPVLDPSLRNFLNGPAGSSPAVTIRGPSGYDDNLNIVPGGARLPYQIAFANPVSGQPVTEIRIVQEIDPDLDVRTFQLGTVRFGDLNLGIPQSRGAYSAEFDLTAERGYVLQMSGGVDIVEGIATWVFRAVDADTGLLVDYPGVGLLAPGETGEISYRIRVNPEAETGAEITAQARVIFGQDAPVDTNLAAALVDNVAPTTSLTVQENNGAYLLTWEAQDDIGGSGVREYTAYVTFDGRNYSVLALRTTDTSFTYVPTGTGTPQFLVLAADNAGNLEASPAGVNISRFPPALNLGSIPLVVPDELQPPEVVEPPVIPPVNSLFILAQAGIPGLLPSLRSPGFDRVLNPFSSSAFARGIAGSGAGVGSVGVAIAQDGSIFATGGAGRNQLFRFGVGGSTSATALATFDTPVYDLAFDSNGGLWATSGGGELLELDPETGLVLGSYGSGITLGLAADPNSTKL